MTCCGGAGGGGMVVELAGGSAEMASVTPNVHDRPISRQRRKHPFARRETWYGDITAVPTARPE